MKTPKLLVALLALTIGAFAQDPGASAPADATKLALAREVIAAMHADKMIDNMTVQMKRMASQAAASGLPADATPERRQQAEELQGRIMDLSMSMAKDLIAKMDQIYAEVYSEPELTAMKTFFTSLEGQSMLAKQPQIMQRIMPLAQQMQHDLMPKIQQLVEEAKARAEATAPTSGNKPAEAPPTQ
jgi:hypothetical protein